jgi:hypothetical protein
VNVWTVTGLAHGSGELVQALITSGLVDEHHQQRGHDPHAPP